MMRHLTIYIMICIAALCYHSCSPEDDINGIFVGKTWKLSNICNDKDAPMLSQDDVDQVNVGGRFVITFSESTFTARATTMEVEGTWQAVNDGNAFAVTITKTDGTESTALGNRFIEMLRGSSYYQADYNTLQLYNEGRTEYLLFRPQ